MNLNQQFICLFTLNNYNNRVYQFRAILQQYIGPILGNSMGVLFNKIRNKSINVDKQLLNASGSKLREYFCSYRSICENFSISIPEYMQIFGSNVQSFDMWDVDRQGFINPMEMFSGLIVFSRVAYEDKIKFLYELFDLNQQGFLQYDDLAFLFMSVCEATCKIYELKSVSFNRQIIQEYLDQFFSDETQLQYEEFIRWSYKTQQIIEYFQIIGHPFKPQLNMHSIDEYEQSSTKSKRISFTSQFKIKKESNSKIKIDQRFLNLIKNDHLLQQQNLEQKTQDFNPVMKWVYGIRIDDIRYPLHYRKTQNYKAANQKFIYICGKNIIVLYPKLNTQKNYSKHRKPVSCIQVSSCDKIVASGEMGINPSIHIWELKSTKCIKKLDRIHRYPIKLLKFTKQDQLLITIGEHHSNSPLVIVNIHTKQKILSTYLDEPVLNIISMGSIKDENDPQNKTERGNKTKDKNKVKGPWTINNKNNYDQFYLILASYIVKCTSKQSNNLGYQLVYHKINLNNTIAQSRKQQTKPNNITIKVGASVQVKQQYKIVLVSSINSMHVFDTSKNKLYNLQDCIDQSGQKQKQLSLENASHNQQKEREKQRNKQDKMNRTNWGRKQIVDIYPSEDGRKLYLLFSKSFSVAQIQAGVHNQKQDRNKQKESENPADHNTYQIKQIIQVNQIPNVLFNLSFVQLIQVSSDTVIIVSLMGDVIKISNFNSDLNALCKSGTADYIVSKAEYESNYSVGYNAKGNKSLGKCLQAQEDVEQQKMVTHDVRGEQDKNNRLTFHKYCQIFKLQEIKGICFLENNQSNQQYLSQKPKLVIASNSLIYIIDQIQKQLLSLQCLEQNITHIHSFSNIYAVATELKYLMIIKDGITIESASCSQTNSSIQNSVPSTINGLKITADNLIVAIGQQIQVYYKSAGNYLQKPPKKLRIDHGIPIHISTTTLPKVFLVITREKNILKLNSESKQKNSIMTAKELNSGHLQTFYPQINNVKIPILFSGRKRVFLIAQPNGDIYYWNSLNHMIKNQSTYSLLSGHSSIINQLIYIDNGFISSGVDDGQIIIWQNSQIIQDNDQQDDHNNSSDCPYSNDNHEYFGEEKKGKNIKVRFNEQNNMLQMNKIKQRQNYNIINTKQNSHLFLQELISFDKFSCDKLPLKDTQIQIVVNDAQFYKDIAKNLNKILNPSNLQLFQPLIQNKNLIIIDHDKKNLLKPTKNITNSYLTFKCSFIYGFASEKNRQSLFYAHHYPENKQKFQYNTNNDNLANLSNNPFERLASKKKNCGLTYKSKQIQYAKQTLLPLNQTHTHCKRSFLYFTGRVAIVWSPILKTQYYYNFHINRITCMAIHPNKMIACTSQISNNCAIVHIWNIDTLTMIHNYKTRHNKYITKIEFSRDGQSLVSLGGVAYQQSIQIYNWVKEEYVCYRFMQDTCFYDIKFNPYDQKQIAVCGLKHLCIMQVSNLTLIKKQEAKVDVDNNQEITCMAYTSSIYGNTIQSDIITGDSAGQICLFICGKYIVCKKQAHDKAINCLRLCQLFKYKTVIITAGQDNMVKIWDIKFEEITCVNIRDILQMQKNIVDTIKISIAPQSIDIYHCCINENYLNTSAVGQMSQEHSRNQWGNHAKNKHKEDGQTNLQTLLLVGTRNGCIFQIKISNEYQGLKLYVANNQVIHTIGNSEDKISEQNKKVSEDSNAQNNVKQIDVFATLFGKEPQIQAKNNTKAKISANTNSNRQLMNTSKKGEQKPTKRQPAQIAEKVQINYLTHFHNLPSALNRSAMFDIKANSNININLNFSLMVVYSRTSQYFTLWNLDKRQIIKIQKLNNNSYPSIIKFSKTNFIAVGYLDGKVQFYQICLDYNFILRKQHLFYQSDYQPVKIAFSQNDSRIAVVYSREHQQKRISNNINLNIEDLSSQGQQMLFIYQRVFSSNQNAPFISNQKNTHIIQNQKRKFKNIFWFQFNSGGNKLLICYTLNDYLKLNNTNRRRLMTSYQTNHYQPLHQYVLYDTVRRMEKDHSNEQFNVLNFSPSVRAKYHYYKDCKAIQQSFILTKNQQYSQILDLNLRKTNLMSPQTLSDKINSMSYNSSGLKSHADMAQVASLPVASLSVTNNMTQVVQEYVPISQITQYQNFTIMGTIYGEIFAIKSQNFYSINIQQLTQCQQKVVKAKCFAVYDSPINNMQVVGNRLFITAKDCGCISQYEMHIQKATGLLSIQLNQSKLGEKDKQSKNNININKNLSSNFGNNYKLEGSVPITKYFETFSSDKIQNWLKYVFPKRKNFFECKLNCLGRKHPKQVQFGKQGSYQKDQIVMQPYRIIGRNAFYKRNNILTDLKDNLISFSGCNLLIMSPNTQNPHQYKQQFLKLDNSVFSVNPQISTIVLSNDKRTLYAGTTEQNCQIIIWDISTRTQLQHICFKDYVSVVIIKISERQNYAIVLAVSKQAKQVLFFISLKSLQILASFCVSQQAEICDLEFLPSNQFKFMACGVNYMAQWSLRGGLLNFQRYNMKIDSNQNPGFRQPVIFYSIIFIKDLAVAGGSDGNIYWWNDKNTIKKQTANLKSAVLSLYTTKNSRIFASGGVDGRAIIWSLGSSSIPQKVYQFSIYSGKDQIIPSKYHIQSVNIGKDQIFIGTRSGQIYRFQVYLSQLLSKQEANINCSTNHQSNNVNNNKSSKNLILSAFDNDQVNSCSFNISSQKLYVLTQSGIFSIFNLLTNEQIQSSKIKLDNQEIVKMLVCKLSCKIYIILKKSIDVYTYREQSKNTNKFSKAQQSLKLINSEIKSAILSLNQRYLALLTSPNHLQNAKVQIYDMTQHDDKQFYMLYKIQENIRPNIQIIDYSTDNGYLVYKNLDDQQTIIDLTTREEINKNMIQFQLEWNQQAKKTSEYIRDICSTYSDENKLRTILQVMNHSIIVTDEMGSLRIFKYEQNIEENVNSVEYDYYQIYLEHLNDVYLCMISADCSIVVTVGRYDRSIILWKIKNFDMLMSKAMNNMNNGSSISNGKNYSSSKNKVGNSPNFKLNRINNFNDILNLTNTQNQK